MCWGGGGANKSQLGGVDGAGQRGGGDGEEDERKPEDFHGKSLSSSFHRAAETEEHM